MSEPDLRIPRKRGMLTLFLVVCGLGVQAFILSSLIWVWLAKWGADDAEAQLRQALNQMMAQHYSVAQFGADPEMLDGLQAQASSAPDAELLQKTNLYIAALDEAIPDTQPEPTGPLAVAYVKSNTTLTSLKDAVTAYEASMEAWRVRTVELPGRIPVTLQLAPKP